MNVIPMSRGTTRHRVRSYFIVAMAGNHNLRSGIDKSETPTKNGPEMNRMKTVSFAKMEDCTVEDIAWVEEVESKFAADVADRVLAHLKSLETEPTPLQVDRLEHSLQTESLYRLVLPTRAQARWATVDYITNFYNQR